MSEAKVVSAASDGQGYNMIRGVLGLRIQRILSKKWTNRLLFLPDFTVWLARLMVDPRTSAGRRLLAGSALGYLVVPTDIISDLIPGLGFVDDLAFLALTVRELLVNTEPEVARELWPNQDTSIIDAVQISLEQVSDFLPQRFWSRWKSRRLF